MFLSLSSLVCSSALLLKVYVRNRSVLYNNIQKQSMPCGVTQNQQQLSLKSLVMMGVGVTVIREQIGSHFWSLCWIMGLVNSSFPHGAHLDVPYPV